MFCLSKKGTAQWYHNSLRTFPFTDQRGLEMNLDLENSGVYYCYGYSKLKKQYFLSQTRIQVYSKFHMDIMAKAYVTNKTLKIANFVTLL